MDGEEHDQQVSEMIADEAYHAQFQSVPDECMMNCAETPVVAWKIGYDDSNGITDYTRWIYICDCCDGESRKLAPYWWNKALRGETLDGEEE
jgi:hypothetical protein